MTSLRTLLVAVAVQVIHGVLGGTSERTSAKRENDGLKSLLLKYIISKDRKIINSIAYHFDTQ